MAAGRGVPGVVRGCPRPPRPCGRENGGGARHGQRSRTGNEPTGASARRCWFAATLDDEVVESGWLGHREAPARVVTPSTLSRSSSSATAPMRIRQWAVFRRRCCRRTDETAQLCCRTESLDQRFENIEPGGTPGGDDSARRSDADDGTCEPGRVERQEALHGFTMRTPMSAKSSTFLVATVAP